MASIVPSLLAGDLARLGESLGVIEALGVSSVHIDVMDGHFRPQISVGQPVVRSICKATRLKVDVHLMIERPERFIEDFVEAGASSLAIHLEATQNLALALDPAQRLGAKVGLALNAATPVGCCFEVLEDVDFVLLETGTEGFLPRSLKRVMPLARERETRGLHFAIAVEGDIDASEADKLFSAGADILVVSSAIFDEGERGEAMRALARALNNCSAPFGQGTESRVQ
ncbi:MAG: ribulose-phosphate 3-epimerase [Acidobacteria bacterium]|nr:MAG: ribulose-phosphate 3-epimerase [Acidobacteriota bacterium]